MVAHSSTGARRPLTRLVRSPIDPWIPDHGYEILSAPLAIAHLIVPALDLAKSAATMVLVVGLIVTGLTMLPVVGLGWFEIWGAELFLESPLRRNPPSMRSVRALLSDLFLPRETWLPAVLPCWKIAPGCFVRTGPRGPTLAGELPGATIFPGERTVLRFPWQTVPVDSMAAAAAGIAGIPATWATRALLGHLSRASARIERSTHSHAEARRHATGSITPRSQTVAPAVEKQPTDS